MCGPVGVETATRPATPERSNAWHSPAFSSRVSAMVSTSGRSLVRCPSILPCHARMGQGLWSPEVGPLRPDPDAGVRETLGVEAAQRLSQDPGRDHGHQGRNHRRRSRRFGVIDASPCVGGRAGRGRAPGVDARARGQRGAAGVHARLRRLSPKRPGSRCARTVSRFWPQPWPRSSGQLPTLEVHDVFRLEDPRNVLLEMSRDAAMVVLGSRAGAGWPACCWARSASPSCGMRTVRSSCTGRATRATSATGSSSAPTGPRSRWRCSSSPIARRRCATCR